MSSAEVVRVDSLLNRPPSDAITNLGKNRLRSWKIFGCEIPVVVVNHGSWKKRQVRSSVNVRS